MAGFTLQLPPIIARPRENIIIIITYYYLLDQLFTETSGKKQWVLWPLDRSLLPSASPRATTAVSGPQNSLFPSVSVNK